MLTMLSDVEFLEDEVIFGLEAAEGTPCSYLMPARASTTCEGTTSCLLSYNQKGRWSNCLLLANTGREITPDGVGASRVIHPYIDEERDKTIAYEPPTVEVGRWSRGQASDLSRPPRTELFCATPPPIRGRTRRGRRRQRESEKLPRVEENSRR